MILHVKAVGAIDVPKMDLIGKADPFLVLIYSKTKEKFKTKVCKKTYTPIWDEEFHIPVEKDQDSFIHAELYDWDRASSNDLISTRDFPINSFKSGVVIDDWYEFNAAKKIPKPGRVHLIFHLALPSQNAFKSSQKSLYRLPKIKITPKEFGSLEEAFREIDEDQSGSIDLNETRNFLQKIGINQAFAQLAYEICGKNVDSEISFDEFYPFYKTLDEINKDPSYVYRYLFDKFDADHTGFLEKSEVVKLLCFFGGDEWSKEAVENFIDNHDTNKDGRLNFDEICHLFDDEVIEK
ncbi:Protein Aster-C [Tritrichomonas musculus]|uniref:Protein Aster-C n=1 Tax=Tritrichomonas musculus TaxID=1915356 RepID=A0ABR2JQH1_9EUKA